MKIKDYLELMMEEIEDARHYKKKAHHYPEFKDTYKTMAMNEMQHYKDLEQMMFNSMSQEDKDMWNDLVKLMYSLYEEKYEELYNEIKEI